MSVWTDGVISRYDVLVCLRLLERKWKRVDAPLYLSSDSSINALGIISPCFDTEEEADAMYTRRAGFDIRLDLSSEDETDELEGSLLHEIVHAGQIERVGNDRAPRSSAWATKNSDETGSLDFDGTVDYYRTFQIEREAKELEIALVFRPMSRGYWSALLKECGS